MGSRKSQFVFVGPSPSLPKTPERRGRRRRRRGTSKSTTTNSEMLLVSLPPRPPPTPLLRRSQLPIPLLHSPTLRPLDPSKRSSRKGRHQGVCRSELAQDAPFAVAIGACILNSLVFPVYREEKDDGDGETIDSTDMMFAAMGVISFIPYFDWMSWIFAWLDSGRRRYIVYSIVYLLPYLRTNLSLSPEESWLPIASIVVCIIHVQLEISVMNGDLSGIMLLDEVQKLFSKSSIKEKRSHRKVHTEVRKRNRTKLPSAQQESRDKIKDWKLPGESVDRYQQLNESEDADEERRND